MGVRKKVEQDYSKTLFVNDGLSQKEIALRINVAEKTVGNWVKKGKWEDLRISMLVTRDNQVMALYKQLENATNEIKTRPIIRDIPAYLLKPIKLKDENGCEMLEYPKYNAEDYPIKSGNTPNSKDADIILKITNSIKKLETETNIGDTVSVCKDLIQFVSIQDPEFSKQLLKFCDAMITEKLSKNGN